MLSDVCVLSKKKYRKDTTNGIMSLLTTFHKWFTVINLVPYLFNRDCRQPVAMSGFPKKTTL
jgi:hypothetical protein